MKVNTYYTKVYENISDWTIGENKPNSNPIKPNCQKAEMNVNSLITKDYRKKDDFAVRKNKPNTKPIKPNLLDAQMNVTSFLTKYYENVPLRRLGQNKPKTNPIPQRDTQYAIRDTRYKPQSNPIFLNHDNLGIVISAYIFPATNANKINQILRLLFRITIPALFAVSRKWLLPVSDTFSCYLLLLSQTLPETRSSLPNKAFASLILTTLLKFFPFLPISVFGYYSFLVL